MDLSLSAFGQVIKMGWSVTVITLNQLVKGLCDNNRMSDAMDVVLRRMQELGCTPNILSYNTLMKGLCTEKKSQKALELLHMMADDGYNTQLPT
jgi:pentatricopeptide repeat protein